MLKNAGYQKSNQIFIILSLSRRSVWRAHLRGIASGQHSSEETSQRWRHCVQFDRRGNPPPPPPPPAPIAMCFTAEPIGLPERQPHVCLRLSKI